MSRSRSYEAARDRIRIAEKVLRKGIDLTRDAADSMSFPHLDGLRSLLELALRSTADAISRALILGVPCDAARDLREDVQRRRDEISRWLLAPSPYL